VRLERAGRVVPVKIGWERIEVALPDDEPAEVSAVVPFNLVPQGVVRCHGVVTPAAIDAFAPADYTMLLNLHPAFAAVRDGTGARWTGHYPDDGSIAVRVIEPRTPDEHRRSNLAAANAALLRDDAAAALTPLIEMLRADPNDLDALSGSALAFLDLRRYREAAAAFERLLPRVPVGERTTVFEDAAFAYVALGLEARAEAILTTRYGASEAKRRMVRIRNAVGKR
jgi:tetratricopeptide (TPR) repeat protein